MVSNLKAEMMVDAEAGKRKIRSALRSNRNSPRMVLDAAEALGVSQPTLWRIIHEYPDLVEFLEELKEKRRS